jgi:NAD(P)H-hydrate epimerase
VHGLVAYDHVMRKISVAEARAIDRDALERLGMPTLLLMENAGRAVAEVARTLGERFVILAGSGNNGGDGLVAARHLGPAATVYLASAMDPQRAPDAALQQQILERAGWDLHLGQRPDVHEHSGAVWIDAIFGIGLSRAPEGLARAYIECFNAARGPKVAVDVPSGIHADSGAVLDVACRADVTVSFEGAKLGLCVPCAQPYVGRIVVASLGLA